MNKIYVSDHQKLVNQLISPNSKLDPNSELVKNKHFAQATLKLFNTEASPSFLDDSILQKFSETYMIICELDELKDENFIFSERLKKMVSKFKLTIQRLVRMVFWPKSIQMLKRQDCSQTCLIML
jgi:hypothetical protein